MEGKELDCKHCDKTWEMDPVFLVECPSCEAGVGEKCRRPSGHLVWNQKWDGLPKGAHAERDIKALKEGAYGECPLGKCPSSVEELPRDNPYSPKNGGGGKRKKTKDERQMSMFEEQTT